MFNMVGKSLLDIHSLSKKEFLYLIDLAKSLKKAKYGGYEHKSLSGKNIVILFEKDSTRTRCAFEVAAYDQGMHATFVGPSGGHMGKKESIKDTARVLGRMYDGIEYRGFSQKTVEDLAKYSGVPVWNGLTDEWHPTQMLADVLTMVEHSPKKPIEEISFVYVGDARFNMGNSLLVTGALLGMDVRIGAPKTYQPPQDVIDLAEKLAKKSGARIICTDDVEKAAKGVDYVHTDVWVSMGEGDEVWKERVTALKPYQVNARLMQTAGKDAKFMHCLPAFHNNETVVGAKVEKEYGLKDGIEVTEEVFESDACIAFDQAENRLHTIKAVMVATLGPSAPKH